MKSVLTLGTFDGVHRGHQRILKKVVERARARKIQPVALAFAMPPKLGHTPAAESALLTTLEDKLQILKRRGIRTIQILTFDKKTASTPAETFFIDRILKRCGAEEMVVGPRIAFGRDRAGTLTLLRKLGREHHVRIHVVGGVTVGKTAVSSSAIRQLLHAGHVEKAKQALGYPYSISGKVIHGSHRGRKLGYPTANIAVDIHKILPPGVFWVKVVPATRPLPLFPKDLSGAADGLCNVGTRPTFNPLAKKLLCEVFLFKKPAALYGKSLRVIFMRRIRSEKRFNSVQALQQQISRDFQKAQKWAR